MSGRISFEEHLQCRMGYPRSFQQGVAALRRGEGVVRGGGGWSGSVLKGDIELWGEAFKP